MRSVLSMLRERLTGSSAESEAEQLPAAGEAEGVPETTRIQDVRDRSLAQVSGIIRNLMAPAPGQGPALAAELYDGTGALTIVWLGRREIPGIDCGVSLRVFGRVTMRRGVPTVFNPRYEILPQEGTRSRG